MAQSLAQIFAEAQARIRTAPTDLVARSNLWQVFAARGEFDRARLQLDMMLKVDASWAMEVQGCHSLIDAEMQRSAVFEGRESPVCLGTPPPWFGALASALPLLAQGHIDAASRLLEQVRDQAEPCSGSINGEPFEWIIDGDARLGPCLEVVAQGRYVWMSFELLRQLKCEPPRELRDLIWLPAKLALDDSGDLDVFLPVRYPGATSEEHRMARHTDWRALSGTFYLGHGQKCLSTDAEMTGLLDLRELRVDT
jgi:type VI secretion system protein ImpE